MLDSKLHLGKICNVAHNPGRTNCMMQSLFGFRSTEGNLGLPGMYSERVVWPRFFLRSFLSWGCTSHVFQQCNTTVALQFPPSLHKCRCGLPLDFRGHQPVLESVVARVCREVGAKVSSQSMDNHKLKKTLVAIHVVRAMPPKLWFFPERPGGLGSDGNHSVLY